MLQVELTNIEDIYDSYKTTIISAIDLLHTDLSFDGQSQSHICHRRSLLPFLGDGLRWLMGTATTKDINSIKPQINQLIATQSSQQETLVHVISILNITRYAAQVNRHSINILMDEAEATSDQFLLTFAIHSTTSEWFIHISWTILMQPHEEHSLHTSYLSWIYKRCCYIYQIPYHLHCPYLFHQMFHPAFFTDIYTHTFWLKTILLLIDVPIQDRSWQITIHEVFTLSIPHGNFSACYAINTKYLGITKDETMTAEHSTTQFQVCWETNGQFCSITTPFQPLANPPSCVSALYARNPAGITSWCSLQMRKTCDVNLPTQISPDVWILTTPLSTPAKCHHINMSWKGYRNHHHKKTLHILRIQFNSIQLVTWYSTLLNAEHYGRSFTVVCLPGHCYALCHSFVEGEPPSPRSTPWEAYRPTHLMRGSASLFSPCQQHSCSLTVDRSMVVGHIPMDHTCSFMCTNHIDMTVHNMAFLWVR